MKEDRHSNSMESAGVAWRVLAMVLSAAFVAAWLVWGLSAVASYEAGLSNSSPLWFELLLGPLILVAAIDLSVRFVRVVSHRAGLGDRKWRRRVLAAVTALAFVGSLVLACSCGGTPGKAWARGIARHIRTRADIEGIQTWLSTLGPNDLDPKGLRHKHSNVMLERSFAISEQPAAMAGLKGKEVTVHADDDGHLTVRLWLGGGGFMMHWGLVVRRKDMPIPPSDTSDFGEEHFPLAPGAYIWLRK